MRQKKHKLSHSGIAYKTSVVTGVVILLFMSCTTAAFIYMESGLVRLSAEAYARSADQLISERTESERHALEVNMRAFTEICSHIASSHLYNFNSDSFRISLMAYMKIPAIQAIHVESAFGAFMSAWKKDGIRVGKDIPEDYPLNETLLLERDVFHKAQGKQHKVGRIRIYFTQEFMAKRIEKEKEQVQSQLGVFNDILTEKFSQLRTYQILFIITATILLFCTTNLTLKLNAVRPLNRVIRGILKGIRQLTIKAQQISYGSKSVANDATKQAAAIEDISASLEEMSDMTRQNANNTQEADQLMQQADQVMDKTRLSVEKLTRCMSEIGNAGEATRKIVKFIDEIAFQTNLLALNAAVEAARAGETGRGFAVVADEVRRLAMRTAEATSETENLIQSTVKKVDQGIELVEATNTDFAEMAANVSEISQLIAQISAASAQQSDGVEQIKKNVSEVDKITQQNAGAAQESAGASEELSAQTITLKNIVRQLPKAKAFGLVKLTR